MAKISGDTAIKVTNIGKTFKLPHEKTSSVKSAVLNFWRKRRTYEIQEVLHDISFEIKKGEFFGIIGRNGSGKSTLLKLLAGIYAPTKGSIEINGKLTPFIELGVGFNPELTGRENVFLNGALLGFNRKEMSAMYDDIVEFAELEKFMDQKLKNYSSGMQVRLAFSIAIRAESDMLLIDEVLAVGDQSFQEKCFRYFAEIKKSDKTVILVTHDMSNVERFCERVLVIDKNQKNNEVLDIPEAVAKYNLLNHPPKISKTKGEVRSIKKKLYIKQVELVDKYGASVTKFQQGDSLRVRIRIGVNRNTMPEDTAISLGLAIYDSENVNLTGPNTRGINLSTKQLVHDYYVKSIPFNMGEYRVTVALFDGDAVEQYDIIDREVSFFINTDDVQYGKINLNGTWQ